MSDEPQVEPVFLRLPRAFQLLGVGRTKGYELVKKGSIPVVRAWEPDGPPRVPYVEFRQRFRAQIETALAAQKKAS